MIGQIIALMLGRIDAEQREKNNERVDPGYWWALAITIAFAIIVLIVAAFFGNQNG